MIILITGAAGSGKTFLTNRLKTLHKDWSFTAYTQEAASLIEGKTLHKRMRKKPGKWFDEMTEPNYRQGTVLIDEASMLSQEMLDSMIRAKPRFNFVLVGDFNQLLPVDGSPITRGIDKVYELQKNWRATEESLQVFLNGILNNYIDWSIIEDRKAIHNPDNKTLLITFFNENKKVWNNEYNKLARNSPVKGHNWMLRDGFKTTYRDSRETRFTDNKTKKKPVWNNNELFTITDLSDFDVVIYNERLGAISLPKDIFDDYFEPHFSCTFYGVQGQTRRSRTVVDLSTIDSTFIDADKRIRSLYVACSRVTTLKDLEFCFDDLDALKALDYKFNPFPLGNKIKADQDTIVKDAEEWFKDFGGYESDPNNREYKSSIYDSTKGQVVCRIKELDAKGKFITDTQRKERKALCIAYIEEELKETYPAPNKELARRLGVSSGTIINYLKEMSK
jgi:hypothetical protein